MKQENEKQQYLDVLLPLDAHILDPVKGTQWLIEQTVKHQGKWRIHKSDPDDIFPSDPHADRVDEPEKLNLYTGDVYNKKQDYLYTLSKKAMQFIYNKIIANGEKNIVDKLTANKTQITYL
jgi:hypothetical protein